MKPFSKRSFNPSDPACLTFCAAMCPSLEALPCCCAYVHAHPLDCLSLVFHHCISNPSDPLKGATRTNKTSNCFESEVSNKQVFVSEMVSFKQSRYFKTIMFKIHVLIYKHFASHPFSMLSVLRPFLLPSLQDTFVPCVKLPGSVHCWQWFFSCLFLTLSFGSISISIFIRVFHEVPRVESWPWASTMNVWTPSGPDMVNTVKVLSCVGGLETLRPFGCYHMFNLAMQSTCLALEPWYASP